MIKKHLRALKGFSEAELIAASQQVGMEGIEITTGGNDADNESDSSSEDDVPLA